MHQNNNNEVTVIVATYNQKLIKTKLTLDSIIRQKRINVRIIVADDGSDENHFMEIKNYFFENGFNDYILLDSEKNQGTVSNFYRCISYISTPYVKLISPGDYFHEEDSLYRWIKLMKDENGRVSFCDTIYYAQIDNIIKTLSVRRFPQNSKMYKSDRKQDRARYIHLIYDDYWLGASVLLETEAFVKYISMIEGKVIYAEDNMYRLMDYNHEKVLYFDNPAIVYEYSAGISAVDKADEWRKKLITDWYNSSKIMIECFPTDKKITKTFKRFIEWKVNSNVRYSINNTGFLTAIKELIGLYRIVPSAFFWHLKLKLFLSKSLEDKETENYLNCYFRLSQERD